MFGDPRIPQIIQEKTAHLQIFQERRLALGNFRLGKLEKFGNWEVGVPTILSFGNLVYGILKS